MDTRASGVLGVCLIVAALIVTLVPRGQSAAAAPAGEVGRYQFIRSNGPNCFVLDTKNGRLWQRYVETGGGPTNWSQETGPWAEAAGK
jgi:hypothetical protein